MDGFRPERTRDGIQFYLLDELTLPRLILSCLLKRPACVLSVLPILSLSRPLLDRLVTKGQARGWLLEKEAIVPELVAYRDVINMEYRSDIFAHVEPALNRHLNFAATDGYLGDDGYAYRQATINHVRHVFEEQRPERGDRFLGFGKAFETIFEAHFARKPHNMVRRSTRAIAMTNAVLAVLLLGVTIAQVLRRIRLRPASCEDVLLGSDFINDERDEQVWHEIAPTTDDIVIVLRNRAQTVQWRNRWSKYRATVFGSHTVNVFHGLRLAHSACRESLRLWRLMRRLDPAVFAIALLIPQRRMMVRALLARFRFRYFWGRDDYNVEHILRNQELRRCGAVSMGITHGLPVGMAIAPMVRYIDCDFYFVLGRHIPQRYYLDTWARSMKIVPVGSIAMTHERHARLSAPRPEDILFLVKPGSHAREQAETVQKISEAFPDRTVYLKIKSSIEDRQPARTFLDMCAGLPNARPTDESVYDLFFKVRYAVSDPSTACAEAIQFGLIAFLHDIDGRKSLFFRDFPGLCVANADDIINRIRNIENGVLSYDASFYQDLIEMSPRLFYEIIRETLGLPPRAVAAAALAG